MACTLRRAIRRLVEGHDMAWNKQPLPILTPTLPHEDTAVFQPHVLVEGNRWRMWYSAGWHHGLSVCYAECNSDPRVAANWVKRPTPVISGADFNFVASVDGRLHLLYDDTPPALGAKIFAAPSFDNGATFQFTGLSPLVVPDGVQLHQVAPVLVVSGGRKHLLYVSAVSGASWQQFIA